MSYRIGSFNVKNLAFGSKRDLDRIAAIINDNDLDIVAMQEVLSEGKALSGTGAGSSSGQAKAYEYSLKRRLKGHWEICWQDPQTRAKDYPYLGEDKRGEGYAFLWNTDRIELPLNYSGKEIYPKIWRQYKHKGNGFLRLIRDPLYGRFKIKNMNVEIRLLSTHIVYGKPKGANFDVDYDIGTVELRKSEFKTLAGYIYPRIAEYYKDENCVVPYTIMLGDYNLNLPGSGVFKALIPDIVYFDRYGNLHDVENNDTFTLYNVQSEKTTINREATDYANNYDHFTYDDRTKCVVKQFKRIDAVHQHVKSEDDSEEEKFKRYKEEVSDHVPILLEIDFK